MKGESKGEARVFLPHSVSSGLSGCRNPAVVLGSGDTPVSRVSIPSSRVV